MLSELPCLGGALPLEMTSDIILSSQLEKTEEFSFSSSLVLEYFSSVSQEESFSLTLTEEESDWESLSVSSSVEKKPNSISETDCSDSTSVGSQDLFERCSFDLFEVRENSGKTSGSVPSVFQILSQNSQGFASEDKAASLSVKCHTACSQDFYYPESIQDGSDLPFSDAFATDASFPALFEVLCLANKTGNVGFQNLNFDIEKPVLQNLIVCVTMCYPVREIWCSSAKCWQAMGAILLGDHTNKYIKLVLWGKQCHFALSQCCGNIIYISHAQVKSSCGMIILGLTSESKLITLCSALSTKKVEVKCKSNNEEHLKVCTQLNLDWFTSQHYALCSIPVKDILPLSNGEVLFCDLGDLVCGRVVHIAVKIASIDSKFSSKLKNVSCVVCVCSDSTPSLYRSLYLNGSSKQWIPLFQKYYNHTWEIRYVACCMTNNDIELHTTVFSEAEFNFDEKPSSCNTKLLESVPLVVSYNQLISIVRNQVSTQVILHNIYVCSICISSSQFRKTIDRNSSGKLELKQTIAAVLNKSNTRSLLYSINCRFKSSSPIVTLWSSYEDFLSFVRLSSLKSLHNQVSPVNPVCDMSQ